MDQIRKSSALCFLVLCFLVLWLLHGCGAAPAVRSGQAVTSADAAVIEGEQSQWIVFGVVLGMQPILIEGSGDQTEPGMWLDIVLDDGSSLLVKQPLSQAGELKPGNRVRVLRIGGYSRVTYWPYPASR
ncbi:MAG: hypothetical protein V7629_13500 [Motiliproteus sp.]